MPWSEVGWPIYCGWTICEQRHEPISCRCVASDIPAIGHRSCSMEFRAIVIRWLLTSSVRAQKKKKTRQRRHGGGEAPEKPTRLGHPSCYHTIVPYLREQVRLAHSALGETHPRGKYFSYRLRIWTAIPTATWMSHFFRGYLRTVP